MMNRRELNRTFAGAAVALLSGGMNTFGAKAKTQTQSKPSTDSIGVANLLSEPLAEMQDPEVRMLILTVPPSATSHAHRHTGPVFAYILQGSIQNQVEPEPAKTYNRGDFFYEPPMHVHRLLKNLSITEEAKILIVEVGEKGEKFTIEA